MKSGNTDLELWQMMSADDPKAFEEIYNRYSKGMFIYALNIFRKEAICEDVVQNIFVDLWSRRNTVKIINVKAYLFQSVKFQVLKQMRDERIPSEDLTRLNIIDLSTDISQKLEFEELESMVKEVVQRMPPGCQKVFVMSRFESKSNKEIASELEISLQAVKNQIGRALKFLKEELDPQKVVLLLIILGLVLSNSRIIEALVF